MYKKYRNLIITLTLFFFLVSNYTGVFAYNLSNSSLEITDKFIDEYRNLKIEDSKIDNSDIIQVSFDTFSGMLENSNTIKLDAKIQVLLSTSKDTNEKTTNGYKIIDAKGKNNLLTIPSFNSIPLSKDNIYQKAYLLFTPNNELSNLTISIDNDLSKSFILTEKFEKNKTYLIDLGLDLTSSDITFISQTSELPTDNSSNSEISYDENNTINMSVKCKIEEILQSSDYPFSNASFSDVDFNMNLYAKWTQNGKNTVDSNLYKDIKFWIDDSIFPSQDLTYIENITNGSCTATFNLNSYHNSRGSIATIFNVDELGFVSNYQKEFTFEDNLFDNIKINDGNLIDLKAMSPNETYELNITSPKKLDFISSIPEEVSSFKANSIYMEILNTDTNQVSNISVSDPIVEESGNEYNRVYHYTFKFKSSLIDSRSASNTTLIPNGNFILNFKLTGNYSKYLSERSYTFKSISDYILINCTNFNKINNSGTFFINNTDTDIDKSSSATINFNLKPNDIITEIELEILPKGEQPILINDPKDLKDLVLSDGDYSLKLHKFKTYFNFDIDSIKWFVDNNPITSDLDNFLNFSIDTQKPSGSIGYGNLSINGPLNDVNSELLEKDMFPIVEIIDNFPIDNSLVKSSITLQKYTSSNTLIEASYKLLEISSSYDNAKLKYIKTFKLVADLNGTDIKEFQEGDYVIHFTPTDSAGNYIPTIKGKFQMDNPSGASADFILEPLLDYSTLNNKIYYYKNNLHNNENIPFFKVKYTLPKNTSGYIGDLTLKLTVNNANRIGYQLKGYEEITSKEFKYSITLTDPNELTGEIDLDLSDFLKDLPNLEGMESTLTAEVKSGDKRIHTPLYTPTIIYDITNPLIDNFNISNVEWKNKNNMSNESIYYLNGKNFDINNNDKNKVNLEFVSSEELRDFKFTDNFSDKITYISTDVNTENAFNYNYSLDLTDFYSKLLSGEIPIDQPYTITVTGRDVAGNELKSITYKFILDIASPKIEIIKASDSKSFDISNYAYNSSTTISIDKYLNEDILDSEPNKFKIHFKDSSFISPEDYTITTEVYDKSIGSVTNKIITVSVTAKDLFNPPVTKKFNIYVSNAIPTYDFIALDPTKESYTESELNELLRSNPSKIIEPNSKYNKKESYDLGLIIDGLLVNNTTLLEYSIESSLKDTINHASFELVPINITDCKTSDNKVLPSDFYNKKLYKIVVYENDRKEVSNTDFFCGEHTIKFRALDAYGYMLTKTPSDTTVPVDYEVFNFIFDDNTPSYSDFKFATIDKNKAYKIDSNSTENMERLFVNGDFTVKFILDKLSSGYPQVTAELGNETLIITDIENTEKLQKDITIKFDNLIKHFSSSNGIGSNPVKIILTSPTGIKKEINFTLYFDDSKPTLTNKFLGENSKDLNPVIENFNGYKVFNQSPIVNVTVDNSMMFYNDLNSNNLNTITLFKVKNPNLPIDSSDNLIQEDDITLLLNKQDTDTTINTFTFSSKDNNPYIFKSGYYDYVVKVSNPIGLNEFINIKFIVDDIDPKLTFKDITVSDDESSSYEKTNSSDEIRVFHVNKQFEVTYSFKTSPLNYKTPKVILKDKKTSKEYDPINEPTIDYINNEIKAIFDTPIIVDKDGNIIDHNSTDYILSAKLESTVHQNSAVDNIIINYDNKPAIVHVIDTDSDSNDVELKCTCNSSTADKDCPLNKNNVNTKYYFTKDFSPIISISDPNIDMPIDEATANKFIVNKLTHNSIILTSSKKRTVGTIFDNVDVKIFFDKKTSKLKLGINDNGHAKDLTEGEYIISFNIMDYNGNVTSTTINFAIENSVKDFSATVGAIENNIFKEFPSYDTVKTYYSNKSSVIKVHLPPQLKGYSKVTATLKYLNEEIYAKDFVEIKQTDLSSINSSTSCEFYFDLSNVKFDPDSVNLSLNIVAETPFTNTKPYDLTIVHDVTETKPTLNLFNDTNSNNSIDNDEYTDEIFDNTINSVQKKIKYNPKIEFILEDSNLLNNGDSFIVNSIKIYDQLSNLNNRMLPTDNDYKEYTNFKVNSVNNSKFIITDKSNANLKNGHYKVSITTKDKNLNIKSYSYNFIIDSNKPNLSRENYSFVSDGKSKVIDSDNSTILVNGNFKINFSLPYTYSDYDKIDLILMDTNNTIEPIKGIQHNKSENNDVFYYTFDFNLPKLKNKVYDFILTSEVTTGSGIVTKGKDIHIKYDIQQPELNLKFNNNEFDSEIDTNKLFYDSPSINIALDDFTINNKNLTYTGSGNLNLNNNLSKLNLKSFKYTKSKDYDISDPKYNLSDVILSSTSEDLNNFTIGTINNNGIFEKYNFKAGVYEFTLESIDPLGNLITKTYNFVVDSIKPDITYTNIINGNNEVYSNSDFPKPSDILFVNDTLTIKYTFNDNNLGFNNISIKLYEYDKSNPTAYKNSTPVSSANKCTDNNCKLNVNESHSYTLDLSELKDQDNKLYIIETTLNSNGNGPNGPNIEQGLSTIKKYLINLDTTKAALSIFDADKELSLNGKYTTKLKPTIKVTDNTFDFNSSNVFSEDDNTVNSTNFIKLISVDSLFVDNNELKPNEYSAFELVKITEGKDTGKFKLIDKTTKKDFEFSEGKHSIIIHCVDKNGNGQDYEFTFNIEINAKEISATTSLPLYNEKYFGNKDNFESTISLTQQVLNYKHLQIELTDMNDKVLDTFIYDTNSNFDKGTYTIPLSFSKVTMKNINSKNLKLIVTATTAFDHKVQTKLDVVYDEKAPNNTCYLKSNDSNKSLTLTNNIDENARIQSINYTPVVIFDVSDSNIIKTNDISDANKILSANIIKFEYSPTGPTNTKYTPILDLQLSQSDTENTTSSFKAVDKNGENYNFKPGYYSVQLKTIDKNRNSDTYNYKFIVDTANIDFSSNFYKTNEDDTSVDTVNKLKVYNDIYYINSNFGVLTDFNSTLSEYKSLTAKLSYDGLTNPIEIDLLNDKQYHLSPNTKHQFLFNTKAIPSNTTIKLNITLTNYAGTTETKTTTFIYDTNAPSIKLSNSGDNLESMLNVVPEKAYISITDKNIDKTMQYKSDSSLKLPNTFTIISASKEALTMSEPDSNFYKQLRLELDSSSTDTNVRFVIKNSDNTGYYKFDDGRYTLEIQSTDLNGNTSGSFNFEFTVGTKDTTGSITLESGSNQKPLGTLSGSSNLSTTVYVNQFATLKFNLDGHISGFEETILGAKYKPSYNSSESNCNFNDLVIPGSNTNITSTGKIINNKNSKSISLKFETEGIYRFENTIKSASGTTPLKINIVIIVDKTDPVANLSSISHTAIKDNIYYTNSENPQVKFTATDDNFLKVESITINNKSFNDPTFNNNILSEFSSDGIYNIFITVVDKAGNKNTVNQNIPLKLVVDKEKPNITPGTNISFNAVDGVKFTNNVTHFDYNVTDTYLEKEFCSVNGMSYSKGSTISGDGQKSIKITASDIAGNSNEFEMSYVLDTTAPNLSFKDIIGDKHYNVSVLPKFDATDTYLDQSTVSSTINGNAYNNASISSDGNYTLIATAKDHAGNIGQSSISFVIDTVAPVITIDGILEDKLNGNVLKPIIKVDDPDATVTSFLNGEAYYGDPIIDNKKFTLLVNAVDKAGNFSNKATTFILDSFAPDIQIDFIGKGDFDKNIFEPGIKINVKPLEKSTLEMSLNNVEYNGEKINDEGDYSLNISATDAAGNTKEDTIDFVVKVGASTASKTFLTKPVVLGIGSTLLILSLIGTTILIKIRRDAYYYEDDEDEYED